MPIVPLESTIISPLWTPGIKLCVERIQGVKASLVLPASLTENRKKICRTASRHATSRLHEELTESLLQQLLLRFDELAAKHKVYFHEYMGQSPLLYDLVVNSELAWVSTLDETVLKRIGNGDRELGIEEIVGAICQIADDELNPTIRKYGRMGPSLSKERI